MIRRRHISLLCAAALLAFASGAAARYHVRIVSSTGDTEPLIVAIVARGGHLVPPSVTSLHLQIDPPPDAMPQITWSSQNPTHVQLMHGFPWEHELRLPGDTSSTPPSPADRINALPGKEPGFSWVSATVGAPVNLRISIPAYAYQPVGIGCAMGLSPAASFDGKTADTIADSDIYVTGPARTQQSFDKGCPPPFATQDRTTTLHVPYGGTTFASSDFVRIRARDWRNAFTEVPAAAGGLIFKTHDGKIVKIQFSSDGRASGASAVAPAGGDFPDAALRGTHARIEAIAAGPSPHGFSARVGYADSIVTTTGTATALFAETALPFRTPFVHVPPAARVIVSPQPYTLVQVTWLLDGKQISQAPLTSAVQLAFDRAGRSTLSAQIGPPISTTVTIPVIAYDSLVVGCGAEVQGVRFERGHAVPATDAQSSDLFVSSDPQRFACGRNAVLNFPGGGVMLTNGHDEAHPIPNGAVAGPQFPNLTRAFWRNTTTQLAGDTWDALADPCTIPESPGVERIDWNCKTLPARTLLFRTRGGAYVKLLLVHANGTMLMGGPYQVLSE